MKNTHQMLTRVVVSTRAKPEEPASNLYGPQRGKLLGAGPKDLRSSPLRTGTVRGRSVVSRWLRLKAAALAAVVTVAAALCQGESRLSEEGHRNARNQIQALMDDKAKRSPAEQKLAVPGRARQRRLELHRSQHGPRQLVLPTFQTLITRLQRATNGPAEARCFTGPIF
jgi:hypothetical protein